MKFLTLTILLISSIRLGAQTVEQKNFNVKNNLAVDGFDVTSYFDGTPLEGKSQFKLSYNGINYLFFSQANLNKFKAVPEKYIPAYGGWCAYAMGETGEKVKVDPETFKIVDGKLNLFYNFWGNNTLSDWNKSEKKLKEAADRNWKKFVQ
jgi:YHS domain-containing protein